MDKYLGNKRVLLNDIYNFTQENCPDARSLFDIFSGTTNVARFFKKNDFEVIANDVNRFSYVIASTYLKLKEYPQFIGLDIPDPEDSDLQYQKARFLKLAKKDNDVLFPYESTEAIWKELYPTTKVLIHLNSLDKKSKAKNYYIHDYYTTFGVKSEFKSIRGTEGKRNYFSEENAIKIDNTLNTIRHWWNKNLINKDEVFILMTAILEEIVIVANVNGTFHDFNRNKLWPNSLQDFKLKTPLTYASNNNNTVLNEDATEAASKATQADILYIDPPYNFRQYSAYYHLINFIAAYPFLDSVKTYLDNITFVRGQHPDDNFTSDFCFKDKFMDALHEMIGQSTCKYIVMSYYGGRNHWNHWSKTEKPTDYGYHLLNDYFNDGLFYENHNSTSLKKLRQNYQSRVGEKKTIIDEYLFFAEKRTKKGETKVNQVRKKYFDLQL